MAETLTDRDREIILAALKDAQRSPLAGFTVQMELAGLRKRIERHDKVVLRYDA